MKILKLKNIININFKIKAIFVFIFVCLLSIKTYAAVPQSFTYTGTLKNASGTALTGTNDFRVKYYNVLTGGTSIYEEEFLSVNINTAGKFFLPLASGTSITGSFSGIDFNNAVFISLNTKVSASSTYDGEMSPRIFLRSVPYALNAGKLDGRSVGGANGIVAYDASSSIQTNNLNASGSINVTATTTSNSVISNFISSIIGIFDKLFLNNVATSTPTDTVLTRDVVTGEVKQNTFSGLLSNFTTNILSFSSTTNTLSSNINGVVATTSLSGFGANFSNTNLIATGNRIHNFASSSLTINNLNQLSFNTISAFNNRNSSITIDPNFSIVRSIDPVLNTTGESVVSGQVARFQLNNSATGESATAGLSIFGSNTPEFFIATELGSYRFPREVGLAGQSLVTDGIGQLSWQNASGTNFANTDLMFTGSRTHALNGNSLSIQGSVLGAYLNLDDNGSYLQQYGGTDVAGSNIFSRIINGGNTTSLDPNLAGFPLASGFQYENPLGTTAQLGIIPNVSNGFYALPTYNLFLQDLATNKNISSTAQGLDPFNPLSFNTTLTDNSLGRNTEFIQKLDTGISLRANDNANSLQSRIDAGIDGKALVFTANTNTSQNVFAEFDPALGIRFGSESGSYTFPKFDGGNGQVLTTNGAGQLSWQAPGSGAVTASNGLNAVGVDVRLGGTLNQATIINSTGNDNLGIVGTGFTNNTGLFAVSRSAGSNSAGAAIAGTAISNNVPLGQNVAGRFEAVSNNTGVATINYGVLSSATVSADSPLVTNVGSRSVASLSTVSGSIASLRGAENFVSLNAGNTNSAFGSLNEVVLANGTNANSVTSVSAGLTRNGSATVGRYTGFAMEDNNTGIANRAGLFLGTFSNINYTGEWGIYNALNRNNILNGFTSIGTTAVPTQALDVAGNIRFSGALMPAGAAGTLGQVLISQGSGLAPQWTSTSTYSTSLCAGSTSIFCQGGNSFGSLANLGTNDNNALALKTNNIERMRILANGNVGIGTLTPNEKLEVNSGVANTSGLRLTNLTSSTAGGPGASIGVDANGNIVRVSGNDSIATYNGLTKYGAGNLIGLGGTLAANTYITGGGSEFGIIHGANFFKVDGSGGILNTGNNGFGIAVPTEKVDIGGNLKFSNALMPAGIAGTIGQVLISQGAGLAPIWGTVIAGANNGLSAAGTNVQLGGPAGAASAANLLSNREIPMNGNTLAFTNGSLFTRINANGSISNNFDANVNGNFISNSDKLGIAATNQIRLTSGSLRMDIPSISTDQQNTSWQLGGTNLSFVSSAQSLFFRNSPSGSGEGAYEFTTQTSGGGSGSRNGIKLLLNAAGGAGVSQEIGQSISVTDNTTFTKDIIGLSVNAGLGTNTNSNRYAALFNGGNVGIGNTNPNFLLGVGSSSISSGVTVARFQNAGGNCDIIPNISGGITCTSDINLKKDIEEISSEDILKDFVNIQIREYRMRADSATSTKQIGFIAQNIEDYFPSIVRTDEGGRKAVSYAGFVPIITKVVQDILTWKDKFTTKELCIEDICIKKNDLQQILQNPSSGSSDNSGTTTNTTTSTNGGSDGNTQGSNSTSTSSGAVAGDTTSSTSTDNGGGSGNGGNSNSDNTTDNADDVGGVADSNSADGN